MEAGECEGRVMLRWWVNLLPLFIVKAIARRRCELFDIHGRTWAHALPDVLVRMTPEWERAQKKAT